MSVDQHGSPHWAGRLQIGAGWAHYVGLAGDNVFHAHHAIQICVALQSTLGATLRDRSTEAYRALVIGPDVEHRLAPSGRPINLIYLDPEAGMGMAVLSAMGTALLLEPAARQIKSLEALLKPTSPSDNGQSIVRSAVEIISGPVPLDRDVGLLDPRVTLVLDAVGKEEDLGISADDLAALVGLSTSRLAHLFKEQVGIPIRPYLLWSKMQRAVDSMAQSATLTQTAHAAGFADSAHMTRTFRRMFGIKPSDLVAHASVSQAATDG